MKNGQFLILLLYVSRHQFNCTYIIQLFLKVFSQREDLNVHRFWACKVKFSLCLILYVNSFQNCAQFPLLYSFRGRGYKKVAVCEWEILHAYLKVAHPASVCILICEWTKSCLILLHPSSLHQSISVHGKCKSKDFFSNFFTFFFIFFMCSLVKFKPASLLKIFKWSFTTNYIMSQFPMSKSHAKPFTLGFCLLFQPSLF